MRHFAFLLVLLVILQSCDSGTESNGDHSILEFSWTTDTIVDPTGQSGVNLQNIAVVTPTDVYAAGWSSNSDLTFWHFDGSEWKVPPFTVRNGGSIEGSFHVLSVFAIAPNDIWAAGTGSNYSQPLYTRIMHFDGSQWLEVPIEPRVESNSGISQIWGSSSTDVWFSGDEGLIFHWGGTIINRDTLKPTPESNIYWATFAGNSFGETYAAGLQIVDDLRNQYLMKLEGDNWQLLNTSHKYLITKLWLSPERTLFGGGEGFLRWNGVGWDQLADPYYYSANYFSGIADDDIVFTDSGEGLLWYNGQEVINIIKASDNNDIWMKGCWYNGKEAFVVATQVFGIGSVVFQGK